MSRKYEKVKDLIPVAMSMLEDGEILQTNC